MSVLSTSFDRQPTFLRNELVTLVPLKDEDFEELYAVAADPLIWEQHPQKDRYKRDVFQVFFNGAMESRGAFMVRDTKTGEAIGSSRFYDADEKRNSVVIGYTFVGRKCWGNNYNNALKCLMLDYAFDFVNTVNFIVGEHNYRSQKAVLKLGAKQIPSSDINNDPHHKDSSVLFQLDKDVWLNRREIYFNG